MRLITGKHRITHEKALQSAATLEERAIRLEHEIAMLTERVAELRAALEYEKKRADQAVDGLLAVRELPMVTPPPKVDLNRSLFEEDAAEVERIRADISERGLENAFVDTVAP